MNACEPWSWRDLLRSPVAPQASVRELIGFVRRWGRSEFLEHRCPVDRNLRSIDAKRPPGLVVEGDARE